MRSFVVLLLFGVMASLRAGEVRLTVPDNVAPLSDKMVDYINFMNTTWTAGHNKGHMDLETIRRKLGVHRDNHKYRLPELVHQETDIPDQFDSRDKWGNCPTIREIRDQGACGSCWAFGAVESMSDRHCIHSGGKNIVHLAADDVLSCCWGCGSGCDGGFPAAAWSYWVDKGIVTGGNYDSDEGCLPYPVPSCDHHINGTLGPCGRDPPTPKCVRLCRKGYNVDYRDDKHHGKA
ncbi:unnamed protein product, partial [Ixodes hexagonus]